MKAPVDATAAVKLLADERRKLPAVVTALTITRYGIRLSAPEGMLVAKNRRAGERRIKPLVATDARNLLLRLLASDPAVATEASNVKNPVRRYDTEPEESTAESSRF